MFRNKAQEKHEAFIDELKSKFRKYIKKCKTIDEVDILENLFNDLETGRLGKDYPTSWLSTADQQREIIRTNDTFKPFRPNIVNDCAEVCIYDTDGYPLTRLGILDGGCENAAKSRRTSLEGKKWHHENKDREYSSGFVINEIKSRIIELEKAFGQLKTGECLYHRVA